MVTNEEKKELLEKYLPITYETQDDTEFQVKLRELLMTETQNGKLYKYRAFDRKGWSFKTSYKFSLPGSVKTYKGKIPRTYKKCSACLFAHGGGGC